MSTLLIGAIGLLYEVTMIAYKGATLGKMAMGVVVLQEPLGQIPGRPASIKRWALPFVAGLIFGLLQLLVYISPLFDARRRGWHDKFAGTIALRSN